LNQTFAELNPGSSLKFQNFTLPYTFLEESWRFPGISATFLGFLVYSHAFLTFLTHSWDSSCIPVTVVYKKNLVTKKDWIQKKT